jgi:hypothetical protein
MWHSHTASNTYTDVDYFQVDWDGYRREAVRIATEAQKAKLITVEEFRYVTKDCKCPIRIPVGNLKVKTHKQMNLYAKPPEPVSPSRAYIDTVNYVTTAWARYLSVKLTPARQKIPNRIMDTPDLIRKLSKLRFEPDCWIISADVVDFYPNTDPVEGDEVIKKHISPELVPLCLEVAKLIQNSIKFLTPIGCFDMSGGYGIGITHSGEVCDLNQSRVEQRVFAMLAQLLLHPSFWGRLVDDYFLVLEGPIADRLKIIDAMEKADPKRPLKVQISSQSIDFLDVTIYKGPKFLTTGILDTKPYTKPSYTGMHLPYSSHHPQSTFDSILSGYHNRSLIASSSMTNHVTCMVQKLNSFRARGYPYRLLKYWLLQETCWKQKAFERQRERRLKRKMTKRTERVVPLKLQYTPRSNTISRYLSVDTLQKAIHKINPALGRVSLGKLTICNLKTKNLMEAIRPTGFLQQVDMDSSE